MNRTLLSNLLVLFLGIATPFIVQAVKRRWRLVNMGALTLTVFLCVGFALILYFLSHSVFGVGVDALLIFAVATLVFKILKDGFGAFKIGA